VIAFLYFLFN